MYHYSNMLFDWDLQKAKINEKKHGINFLQAMTVFDDEYAVYINDDDHSDEEERFIVLGMSEEHELLMVCHCYRDEDNIIRIFSARKANKKEEKMYRR